MNRKITLLALSSLLLLAGCDGTQEEATTTSSQSLSATAVTPGVTEVVTPPQGPVPGSPEDFVASAQDRVFFDFDKSHLTADARATLDRQIAWLQKYHHIAVVIEGHCDERGTVKYNLGLGERRANEVRKYLAHHGIDAHRIKIISYGKERPAVVGHNEASWSQNRRAVTVITEGVPAASHPAASKPHHQEMTETVVEETTTVENAAPVAPEVAHPSH